MLLPQKDTLNLLRQGCQYLLNRGLAPLSQEHFGISANEVYRSINESKEQVRSVGLGDFRALIVNKREWKGVSLGKGFMLHY